MLKERIQGRKEMSEAEVVIESVVVVAAEVSTSLLSTAKLQPPLPLTAAQHSSVLWPSFLSRSRSVWKTKKAPILTRQISRGGHYAQYSQWTPGMNAPAGGGGGNMSPRVFEVH